MSAPTVAAAVAGDCLDCNSTGWVAFVVFLAIFVLFVGGIAIFYCAPYTVPPPPYYTYLYNDYDGTPVYRIVEPTTTHHHHHHHHHRHQGETPFSSDE